MTNTMRQELWDLVKLVTVAFVVGVIAALMVNCATIGGIIDALPRPTPTSRPTAAASPASTETAAPSSTPSSTATATTLPTTMPTFPSWTPDPNWTPAPVSEARGGFGCNDNDADHSNDCKFKREGPLVCLYSGDSTLWQWMKGCDPRSLNKWHCDVVSYEANGDPASPDYCPSVLKTCNGRRSDPVMGFDVSVYKGRAGDVIRRHENKFGFDVCAIATAVERRVITLEICLNPYAYTCKDERALDDKTIVCEPLYLHAKDAGDLACTYPQMRFPALGGPVPPRPRPTPRPRLSARDNAELDLWSWCTVEMCPHTLTPFLWTTD